MAEPKILQVTYGAFSCTLEGFEDPVETLMAVAGYFRDLAASDPGFAGVGMMPDAAEMERQVRAAGEGAVEVRVEPTEAAWQAGAADDLFIEPELAAQIEPEVAAQPEEIEAPMAVEPPLEEAEPVAVEPAPEEPQSVAVEPASERPPRVAAEQDPADEDPLEADLEQTAADRLAAGLAALRQARLAEANEPRPLDPDDGPWEAATASETPYASEEADEPVLLSVEPAAIPSPYGELDPITASAHDWGLDEDFIGPLTPEAQATGPSRGARRLLSTSPDEAALLRILSRAESQLADPEAVRRREALAHAKAAVAAAEAGRALGDVPTAAEDPSPFREDLEVVVRQPAAEARPATPPLRLVASQRVDLPRMKAVLSGPQPLPRREAALPGAPARRPPAPPAADAAGGSFASFAAGLDATDLPGLLEAAAVWLTRGEEQDGASRTRLLDLTSQVLGLEPSREEALRVFGTLLREERLARAGNGRFRPGPRSRLDPARLAG